MINEEFRKLQPDNSHSFKDYIIVILRRRWIIILSFFSVLLSTFYYVNSIEDIYESSSTLVIEENNTNIYAQQFVAPQSKPIGYYEGILNSRSFLKDVVDSIGLENFTSVFPKFTELDATLFVQNNLFLRKTTYTSFLSLSARAKSKALAYSIANVATIVFKNQCKAVESEDAIRTLAEINNQLQLIRSMLEEAEYTYRSFSEKNGQIEDGVTPELKTLQEAYSSELALIGLGKANLDAEKKQLAKIESNFAPAGKQKSSAYLDLRAKLNELEKEKVRLEKLGIRLSGFSTLDKNIREIENKLLDFKESSKTISDPAIISQWQNLRMSVVVKEAELQLSYNKLDSYRKEINLYKKNNPDILSNSLELLRLKRSKEVYENLYSILLERSEEEKIRNAARSAGITIVDLPQVPQFPIPKNEKNIYLAGIFLGLIFGLALAFTVEFNDTTIKSSNDIEKYIGLNVLGIIPHNDNDKSIEITKITHHGSTESLFYNPLSNFDDDSIVTEAYRSLRTNISFVSPDKPLKAIALTSSCQSEGKSITTANLALAYAQMGKRTLLIDADLRRPSLHHFFYKKREPGFSDLFGENSNYDSVIKTTQNKNLSIITAGIPTPNPSEIIGSNKINQLLEYYKSKYDIVIFDTPPIIAVTDAALLGTKVDGLFFVVRSHHTDREIVIRAVDTLKHVGVNILGTILNDVSISHRYTGYGYYNYHHYDKIDD